MGIDSGSKCTASITDVPVASMLPVIRDGGVNSVNDNNQQISIDVDFNYLVCTETRSSDSLKSWAMKAVDMIECMSKCGCIVNHVAYPELRHHSKRASIKRLSNKVISSVKVRGCRFKLNDVTQRHVNSFNMLCCV